MARIMRMIGLAVLIALCQPAPGRAGETPLNRQEVTVIKKKLVEAAAALGQPPDGYGKAEESFDLPTSAASAERGDGYRPVYAGASLRYDGGADKLGKASGKDLEAEYRRKMLEAQASGNYQAMSQIAQEMMQKSSQAQLAVEEARREPVDIALRFNNNPGATIDPDAVLFESPGIIALKVLDGRSDRLQVTIFFDPVKLKDTQSLARIDLGDEERPGVAQKTAVRNIVLEINGPPEVVEAWSKRIATARILAQIDAR